MTKPQDTAPQKEFPADLAFRGGMMVGALLFIGVWLLTKLMTGWGPICL